MSPRMRFLATAVCALLCTWPQSSNSQEQNGSTILVQIPASGVTIDRIDFYYKYHGLQKPFGQENHQKWGAECIAFTNASMHPIGLVFFDVSWVSADGTREVDESVVPAGYYNNPLVPGATSGLSETGKNGGHAFENCRDTNHGGELGLGARAEVFVTNVLYQDKAAAWSLSAPISGSPVNAPGAPLTMTAVQTYWYGFPTFLSPYDVDGVSGPSECAMFQNTSTKATADVFILFRHLGADGQDLGDDKLELKASVPPGAKPRACRTFVAPENPWSRTDAESVASGTNLPARTLLYNGEPSTLSAQIIEVDFADRTSWHSQLP